MSMINRLDTYAVSEIGLRQKKLEMGE